MGASNPFCCRSDCGEDIAHSDTDDQGEDPEADAIEAACGEEENNNGFINDSTDADADADGVAGSDGDDGERLVCELEPIEVFIGNERLVTTRALDVPEGKLREEFQAWNRRRSGRKTVKYDVNKYKAMFHRLRQPENSFATLSSRIRPYAARGCVEVDVDSCGMTIFLALSRRYKFPEDMIRLFEYCINSKTSLRVSFI